jgi:outer membrane protein assembly factor BamB
MRFFQKWGLPYYVVRGNHDKSITDEEFESIHGKSSYWFAHKGWAFIVLDRYFQSYEHTPHSYDMSHETLSLLRKFIADIPTTMPLVLLLHEAPVGITDFHKGPLVMELLANHNLQLILFGHVQSNYISHINGVTCATVVGESVALDSSPLTYNIVTCDSGGATQCSFFPYQINIPSQDNSPVLVSGCAVEVKEHWLSARGPQGTRVGLGVAWSMRPELAWKAESVGGFSVGSPTLYNGLLVIGTKTKGSSDECAVEGFDALSGEKRWAIVVDGSVEGGVLISEGKGYCGTTAGTVFCIDIEAGTIEWQWNNDVNLPITCELTLDDGVLYFGANWEMYALDAQTGTIRWRKLSTGNGASYFSAGHSSAVVVGGRVYHQRPYGGEQSLIHSVDKYTGGDIEYAHRAYKNFAGDRHSSPILWHDKIVTVGDGLFVFEPDNLSEAYLHKAHSAGSTTPALFGHSVYVSYHNEIVAYDLDDSGRELWQKAHKPARYHFSGSRLSKLDSSVKPGGNFSSPIAFDGGVIVCDTGGFIRCFAAQSGEEQWSISLGNAIVSAPIISGNTLFVADCEGFIYAFTHST